MPRRVRLPSLVLLALARRAARLGASAAAAIAPPWCGTPEPDAAEALPSTGTSFPHIPVYAIGCTLADIQSRSLDGRMSLEVHGTSATGRPMYKVVINQLQTDAQQASFDHWTTLRDRRSRTPPPRSASSAAGATASRCRSTSRAASTERVRGRGLEHAHDRAARHDAVRYRSRGRRDPRRRRRIFNVIQNPDGRVAGTRANGNGFDLNRDFLTQSQPETRRLGPIMQEWLPPETIDLHRLLHADARRGDHEAAQPRDRLRPLAEVEPVAHRRERGRAERRQPNVTRPINDWCSDGNISVQGAICPDGGRPARRSPRAGTTGARSTRRCTRSSSA